MTTRRLTTAAIAGVPLLVLLVSCAGDEPVGADSQQPAYDPRVHVTYDDNLEPGVTKFHLTRYDKAPISPDQVVVSVDGPCALSAVSRTDGTDVAFTVGPGDRNLAQSTFVFIDYVWPSGLVSGFEAELSSICEVYVTSSPTLSDLDNATYEAAATNALVRSGFGSLS